MEYGELDNMSNDEGFNSILREKVESFIRHGGPHTSKEVADFLYESNEVYAVVSGSKFRLPESEIDAILDDSRELVRDDSGRWHIASNR